MTEVQPTRASSFQGTSLKRMVPLLSPLILLCLWELSARAHLVDTRFFPGPSGILLVLGEMLQSGELVAHIGVSLQRIAVGFVIGAVPGVLIGIAVGLVPIVRTVVQPLIDMTFPIPKVALLPLFTYPPRSGRPAAALYLDLRHRGGVEIRRHCHRGHLPGAHQYRGWSAQH